jgi:hypothetical protein
LDATELAPDDAEIRFILADAYNKTEKFDLAAAALEKAYTLSGEADIADQFRQSVKSGSYQQAADAARRTYLQRQLVQLKKKSAKRLYVSPTAYVNVYAGLRDKRNTIGSNRLMTLMPMSCSNSGATGLILSVRSRGLERSGTMSLQSLNTHQSQIT